ncbi:MAG: O-antigen polymerase [Parcubacteria group bacterium LiPW_39]|nr:MAG: O-antigen polymerase [Parcubacteria group bacterium LiPW_39]
MKKYLTPLNIVFATEIIVVALASLGLIPREAVLVWTGLAVFYMIFSPLEDALWLTVASIPLFVALPISEAFDSMANWRIIIAVLFLCLFFKRGISLSLIRGTDGKWRLKENLKHYAVEYLAVGFLTLALLSIEMAPYKILAIKKLLFLINIFLLFLIIRNLARNKEVIFKIWQAAVVGGVAIITVALVQFFAVLFVPLFSFWQFWSDKVIAVFYGQNLAYLLSYSNTWFAYYAQNPPTLRLFSVFPDSHSFAMFCILMVPIFLALALFVQKRWQKVFYWLMSGLAFFGIVLSGSRGAWLSVLPAATVLIYIYRKKLEPFLMKKALLTFAIFGLLFFASAGYPPLLYRFQSWQTDQVSTSTFSFFERAKSISDIEETSNKGRLEIWRASLKSISERPFLGVGLGNYVKVLDEDVSAAKKGASAHNLYLDFAAEIGILGVLFLIGMFANILYTSYLVFRKAGEPHLKFFGLLFGLYFVWILGYSFFDVVLLNDKVLLLFMASAATLYGIRNIVINQEKLE